MYLLFEAGSNTYPVYQSMKLSLRAVFRNKLFVDWANVGLIGLMRLALDGYLLGRIRDIRFVRRHFCFLEVEV